MPFKINQFEYETLKHEMECLYLDLNHNDLFYELDIVDSFYKRNENCLPNVYNLIKNQKLLDSMSLTVI